MLDISFYSLDIPTVGDAMALLLLLESRLGATYTIPTDYTGKIDTSKISIHFENEKVNELLARWISECQISDNGNVFTQRNNNPFFSEEQANLSEAILEETKLLSTSDKTPLSL